jgi:hypothetical protein
VRPDDDAGFVLPFILLVTILVLIGTATMLTVVANNAVPARHSQDQETALAAAQAGVQAYLAAMDAHCTSFSVGECSWPNTAGTFTSGGTDAPALSGATYTVTPTNATGFLNHNQDDLRILATGCVPDCTASSHTSQQLLADISGVPNPLRFAYFTNYESISGSLLQSLYPTRQITMSVATLRLLGLTLSTSDYVQWPGVANGSTCDHHWYDGRSTTDSITETALHVPSGYAAGSTFTHVCSVTFSKGMNFVGPVYSADALYLSNGVPTSSTGPSFSVPTACSATVTSACEPLAPASTGWTSAPASKPYRSVADPLGGAPATSGSVSVSPYGLSLSSSATDAAASCTAGDGVAIAFTGTSATLTGARGTCVATITNLSSETIVVNGNASVSGSLTTGKVSVVALPSGAAKGDITVTGDLTANGALAANSTTNDFGENSARQNSTAGAIALVATNDVVVKHDVTCADTSQSIGTVTDFTYCPNDVTGLYTTSQAGSFVSPTTGVLKSGHPARQYCNTSGNAACATNSSSCDSSSATGRTIDAAIFALNGSFRTANYNRGCALGALKVVGGIYQSHRGPLGQEWEISSASSSSARPFSGYRLDLQYESLQYAGLPFVPALRGATAHHPWIIVSVSSPRSGGS